MEMSSNDKAYVKLLIFSEIDWIVIVKINIEFDTY